MIRPLGFALAAAMTFGVAGAQAAPQSLYLSLFADPATPYIEPANGLAHAFLCLSKTMVVTASDVCFGFFPRPEAITSMAVGKGGSLKRTGQDWVESPSGFHFVQQPSAADNVILYDAKRKMTWNLSSPRGGSVLSTPTAKQPWQVVHGVTFEPGAAAFIGGNAAADQYQEAVLLPAKTNVSFVAAVNPNQRDAVSAAIADWNAGGHHLDRDGYLSALEVVATRVGAKAPRRTPNQTPADYVAALARLNH